MLQHHLQSLLQFVPKAGLLNIAQMSATLAGSYAFIRNPATSSVLSCLVPSLGGPMKRRSRAGGEPVKARRRKTVTLKRGIAPKVARRRGGSSAKLQEQLDRRTRERDEALEQQTATSEVLRVISRSTFDLPKVLKTLLEFAARLCEADKGAIFRPTGRDASFYVAASYRHTPEYDEYQKNLTFASGRSGVFGRVLLENKSVQIPDVLADLEYAFRGDYRTILGVPLLREGVPIGVFALQRAAVRPFTEKQISLVETFADQAVIAIENTRLFEAEQQRTRELSELLEQQTATSQVLQVISGSPGELQPVFQTILENATRICEAKFGILALYENDLFRITGTYNVPAAYADYRQREPAVINVAPRTSLLRLAATKKVIHISDYAQEEPNAWPVKLGGARTLVAVPMLKDDELVGAIVTYRQEVRPFTDKQIALVQNFAAQAVIAIENTRLLNELRELLQQQTATADVLKVISRSTFDLPIVLSTLVELAAQLCKADKAQILVPSENAHRFYSAASYGHTLEYNEHLRNITFAPGREGVVGRVLLERKPVQIADVLADRHYRLREIQRLGGFRTHLGLPLLREADLIGILLVSRDTVQPFDDQHIELLTTFADQAVIAIENTRLFEAEQQRSRELTELLEQQTATSEVLQVISSSPGELQPVFATMLENAVRICDAKWGTIHRWEGDALQLMATHNLPPAFAEARGRSPHYRPHPKSLFGRIVATKKLVHTIDCAAEQVYTEKLDAVYVAAVELGGVRTVLGVPMLKENELIGAFAVARQEVRPFTDKQIELINSFANQAVIAIENARLLTELRQRTDDLTESLEQQTATSEVLQVISSSPGDLQPVFTALLANATRICEAKFGNLFLREGDAFRAVAWHGDPTYFDHWREIIDYPE